MGLVIKRGSIALIDRTEELVHERNELAEQ